MSNRAYALLKDILKMDKLDGKANTEKIIDNAKYTLR